MIMLATKEPQKNATIMAEVLAAALHSSDATSLANLPTLPVTCEVNDPMRTKPAELTNPPTSAR
jgi:hypothetical protein